MTEPARPRGGDAGPADTKAPLPPERLLHDLRARPPRIVLDAAARSWTMRAGGDPALYRLGQYRGSDLVTWLERHYRRAGTFDGVGVWVRGEDGRLASPTGFEPVSRP